MKICLLENSVHSWDLTSEELVEKYLLFETEEKIEWGIPFKYKGKCYSICSGRPKENIMCVRVFTEKDGEAINFEGEITCPYCGTVDYDSWERGESEKSEICDVCGSEYSWEREVEVTYSSQPIKKYEIKEIKL